MTTLTEKAHAGGFLITLAPGMTVKPANITPDPDTDRKSVV